MNLRNACQIIEAGAAVSKQVSDITTTKSETEVKAKQQKKNMKTKTNKREVKVLKDTAGLGLTSSDALDWKEQKCHCYITDPKKAFISKRSFVVNLSDLETKGEVPGHHWWPKIVKLDKKLEGMKLDEKKFMANFDPVHSVRETRKMQKKLHNQKSKNGAIYDETGIDMCDCLNLKCPGCFFPCPKCASSKYGGECRVNRKSVVMDISIEGTDITIRNPLVKFRR